MSLVQHLDSCGGSPPTVGQEKGPGREAGDLVMRATPPGTGDAGVCSKHAWPILWRAWVAPSRRNARKGVGHRSSLGLWLKVRANPQGNLAPAMRPDRPKRGRVIRLDYW